MVAVGFPYSKIATPTTGVFFIADTTGGWRAWYVVR